MKKIVQKGDPVLRERATSVPLREITSAPVQKIIKDMIESLDAEDDGVALAAPQIGISLRIFVVSGKMFMEGVDGMSELPKKKTLPDLVCINPEITNISKQKIWMTEGCLSVRPFYGKVERATKATIRAYDEYGNLFTRGASGILAQIFQHETDHLEGILFSDKAKELEEIPLHDEK